MTTVFNETFKQLLTEYNLPADLSFSVDLPPEIQKILDDEIVISNLGITLESFGGLYKATESWDNQSFVEDNENHFHVGWLIEPADNRNAFMLAVKTLTLLAGKFEKSNMQGIRFFLSFQTPELGQQFADANDIDDNEHYISDRLSFHKRRENEEVVTINQYDRAFCAILLIDI
jgi:hypothetical protein